MATLRGELTEWHDWDGAAYVLARSLGIIEPGYNFQADTKGLFWTANPLGDTLHAILRSLAGAGVLEERDGFEEFRWNPDFRGYMGAHATLGRAGLTTAHGRR